MMYPLFAMLRYDFTTDLWKHRKHSQKFAARQQVS